MLQSEIKIFLIVGGCTVCVDYVVYSALVNGLGFAYAYGKILGFLAGTLFAYFANSIWTFKSGRTTGNMVTFLILYTCTLVLNVAVNSIVLKMIGTGVIAVQIAFFAATVASAASNFLGMKFIVFKQKGRNVS